MGRQDRTGQQFGSYRLTKSLGGGGFADVYLGEHIYLETPAAIKVLKHLEPLEQSKFKEEAHTIANLTHPHIVRIMEFGFEKSQGDVPYLVMAYAKNGTLRKQHPRGSKVPLAMIVTYVDQVAQALQYAHNKKIIHRDVKPENMLLNDNEVWLSDFGLAVLAHSSGSQPLIEAIGTLPYMAPEQIDEVPKIASDQYSLGVVVYEWLCGQCPFTGPPRDVMLQQVNKNKKPPSLRAKDPTISAAIEEVVMRALEKDYHDRYASVEEFARDFTRAYQKQTARGAPSPLPPTPLEAPRPVVSAPDPMPNTPVVQKVALPPPAPAPQQVSVLSTQQGQALPRSDPPAYGGLPQVQATPKKDAPAQASPALMPFQDQTARKPNTPAPHPLSPNPDAPHPALHSPDAAVPRLPASPNPEKAAVRPAPPDSGMMAPHPATAAAAPRSNLEWPPYNQAADPNQGWASPNLPAAPNQPWPPSSASWPDPNQAVNSNPSWGTPGPTGMPPDQAWHSKPDPNAPVNAWGTPAQPGATPGLQWGNPNEAPQGQMILEYSQSVAFGAKTAGVPKPQDPSHGQQPAPPGLLEEISAKVSEVIRPQIDSYSATARPRHMVRFRNTGMFLILLSTVVMLGAFGWYYWLAAIVFGFALFSAYLWTTSISVIVVSFLLAMYWAVIGLAYSVLLQRFLPHVTFLPPPEIWEVALGAISFYLYFRSRNTKGQR